MDTQILTARIKSSDYIANYRDKEKFIQFCKNCPRYGKIWSCPPFKDGCKCGDYENLNSLTVIGVKINLNQEVRTRSTTIEERDNLTREILLNVRKEMDAHLLNIEQMQQPSLLFYAGHCHLCFPDSCARIDGKECVNSEKMRSSLEAQGFDVTLTTENLLGVELKWSEGVVLPEYFTLVYGIFSNDYIDDSLIIK